MPTGNHVFQLCFLLIFNTLRSVEESIGYQIGEPVAFAGRRSGTLDGSYVDGVSLTYGSPRQHIWTFANALDEYPHLYDSKCQCAKS